MSLAESRTPPRVWGSRYFSGGGLGIWGAYVAIRIPSIRPVALMGRIRTIKPEFPHSETMGKVSRDARLTFILIWTIVDDSGRTRAASRMLASLLFPYDDDAPKLIPKWLDELEHVGAIRRYQHEGTHYVDIPKWLDHQKIDRPSQSKFPAFDESSRALDDPSLSRAHLLDQGPGPKDQGGGPPEDDVKKAFDVYNAVAEDIGIHIAKTLTKARRAQLQGRLSEVGFAAWCDAVCKLEESPFCRGQNDRGWKAGIDFLLQPSSFAKLMEGSYDATKPNGGINGH